MTWLFPLDPDCSKVAEFRSAMMLEAMSYSVPSDVLRDITGDWERKHRASCERCQQYAAANVEVDE